MNIDTLTTELTTTQRQLEEFLAKQYIQKKAADRLKGNNDLGKMVAFIPCFIAVTVYIFTHYPNDLTGIILNIIRSLWFGSIIGGSFAVITYPFTVLLLDYLITRYYKTTNKAVNTYKHELYNLNKRISLLKQKVEKTNKNIAEQSAYQLLQKIRSVDNNTPGIIERFLSAQQEFNTIRPVMDAGKLTRDIETELQRLQTIAPPPQLAPLEQSAIHSVDTTSGKQGSNKASPSGNHTAEVPNISELVIARPSLTTKKTAPQADKADYLSLQQVKTEIGTAGEQFVFRREVKKLQDAGLPHLAEKVKWVSQEDDTLGYDILSYDEEGGVKYIEVKTTTGNIHTQFYLTEPELQALEKKQTCFIYRVYNFDKINNSGEVYYFRKDQIDHYFIMSPVAYVVTPTFTSPNNHDKGTP